MSNLPPATAEPPTDTGRRQTLMLLCGLWGMVGTGLAIPVLQVLTAPLRGGGVGDAAPVAELPLALAQEASWQPVVLDFATRDAWARDRAVPHQAFVRKHDGEVEVLSAVCTHLGCQVQWEAEQDRFFCPCHHGTFDASGARTSGPPPKPLTPMPFVIQGDRLIVSLPTVDESAA
ncbi:MAG: Cytochrome b6-f complex iron-sulfur subunit [bacterium]|nr:Cytochrome b6-f complex iron-sulfur subunit [bacterium]